MTILECFVRQFNKGCYMRAAPMDWHGVCIVPLYKAQDEMYVCSKQGCESMYVPMQ